MGSNRGLIVRDLSFRVFLTALLTTNPIGLGVWIKTVGGPNCQYIGLGFSNKPPYAQHCWAWCAYNW